MKKRYFLLGLLSGVMLTVAVGGAVSLLIRTGGHGMATPQHARVGTNLVVKVLGEADPKVVLERGGDQEAVSVPSDVVWTHLHVAENGRYAFFVAWKVARFGCGDSWLVRLKLPSEDEPLSAHQVETSLSPSEIAGLLGVDKAWVNGLSGVSEDGEKVVFNASFTDVARSKGPTTYYARGAFVYHFSEDRLEKMSP